MKHRANPGFWRCYRELPQDVQRLADQCYELMKNDPYHPSLRQSVLTLLGSKVVHAAEPFSHLFKT